MPTYAERLQAPEWRNKRGEILSRDQHLCVKCSNERLVEGLSVGLAILSGIQKEKDIINYTLRPPVITNHSIVLPYSSELLEIESILVYYRPDLSNERFANLLLAARKATPVDDLRLGFKYFQNNTYSTNNEVIWNARQEIFKARTKISDDEFKNVMVSIEDFKPFSSYSWLKVNGLHIHHIYYQDGLLPWQYPSSALITFCWRCHEEHHKNEKIQHRDQSGKIIGVLTPCYRCHGAGLFPEYAHVEQGICFRCHGARFEELIEEPNLLTS
jgi:cytochrome c553